jgi:multicomponent K+:H+ antiporter subunit A
VVTIILLLLALNFLPKRTPVESSVLRRVRDGRWPSYRRARGAGRWPMGFLMRDFVAPRSRPSILENS